MVKTYDVIVVGARCAGSPTAMLLARKGYRVLVVDRATFPSDTMSTHMVHTAGVAALARWGLLDRLVATGTPAIDTYLFDFGPFTISGSPRPMDGVATAFGPRRTVLDHLLVTAAVEAGAEVRSGFTVDELLVEDGQVTGIRGRDHDSPAMVERAPLVVGADGRHSLVARTVEPARYHERDPLEAGYYAYWSGVGATAFEVYTRPNRSFAAIPTNDGLTCIVGTWPVREFQTNRGAIERSFMDTLALSPTFAERIHAAKRETRFVGTADLPNFFRQPYGPGWALVGDAGYHKDPGTAQGITDAFLSAELLVNAIDEWLTGRRAYDDAMQTYQRMRDDAALPMYELTCEIASLEPPPPDFAELLAAAAQDQSAMDDFASIIAGTLPVPAFFAPDNVQRILDVKRAA